MKNALCLAMSCLVIGSIARPIQANEKAMSGYSAEQLRFGSSEDSMVSDSVTGTVARMVASDEAMRCTAFLKRGGNQTGAVAASTVGVVALGAAVIVGAVLTGPTIAGPFLIGASGSGLTFLAGFGTVMLYKTRNRYVKMGKLIEKAYIVKNLLQVKPNKQVKAAQYLIWYRDKRLVKIAPETRLDVETLADKIVMLNEAGYFCPADVFEPRGTFTPAWVGNLANYKDEAKGYKWRLASGILRAPVTSAVVDEFHHSRQNYLDYLAECQRAKEEREAIDRDNLRRRATGIH